MSLEELDNLYSEIILDHFRNPRNAGTVEPSDLKAEGYNPFCGDRVVLTAALDVDRRIGAVGCSGEGCAISQASASIMTELVKGQSLEGAEALTLHFRGIMQGQELSEAEEDALGELVALKDVRRFPIRIKCALLPWAALQDAIAEHRSARSSAGE